MKKKCKIKLVENIIFCVSDICMYGIVDKMKKEKKSAVKSTINKNNNLTFESRMHADFCLLIGAIFYFSVCFFFFSFLNNFFFIFIFISLSQFPVQRLADRSHAVTMD